MWLFFCIVKIYNYSIFISTKLICQTKDESLNDLNVKYIILTVIVGAIFAVETIIMISIYG